MIRKLKVIEAARALQYGLIACTFTLAIVLIAYGH